MVGSSADKLSIVIYELQTIKKIYMKMKYERVWCWFLLHCCIVLYFS